MKLNLSWDEKLEVYQQVMYETALDIVKELVQYGVNDGDYEEPLTDEEMKAIAREFCEGEQPCDGRVNYLEYLVAGRYEER